MLRTGVVITDGNNLHAKPGGKEVVDQLAEDDRLWVLEEVQHRKKWLMVQPWRQGGQGYVIADAVRIDNATNPVGVGNSPSVVGASLSCTVEAALAAGCRIHRAALGQFPGRPPVGRAPPRARPAWWYLAIQP